jgi:VanZ family protein
MRARPDRVDVSLWAAAVLCGAATLWFSFVATPPETTTFPDVDKVEHAFAYFATTLLVLLAAVWRPGRGDGPFARWWWALLLTLILAGAAVEVAQGFAGRDAEVLDWIAEIVAVALAWGVLTRWRRRSAVPA